MCVHSKACSAWGIQKHFEFFFFNVCSLVHFWAKIAFEGMLCLGDPGVCPQKRFEKKGLKSVQSGTFFSQNWVPLSEVLLGVSFRVWKWLLYMCNTNATPHAEISWRLQPQSGLIGLAARTDDLCCNRYLLFLWFCFASSWLQLVPQLIKSQFVLSKQTYYYMYKC